MDNKQKHNIDQFVNHAKEMVSSMVKQADAMLKGYADGLTTEDKVKLMQQLKSSGAIEAMERLSKMNADLKNKK